MNCEIGTFHINLCESGPDCRIVGKSCFQRAMDPDSTDKVAQDEENSEEMLQ